jgi:ParB-like chromosome segregation protein Spo0J
MSEPKVGFEMRRIRLSLDDLLPVKHYKNPEENFRRYRTIRDSIKEVGMIEPLMVYPGNGSSKKYYLLDGHLRALALRQLGHKEAECIISKDDESFTYNARINRVSPIQEHRMMLKAVNSGVSREQIARALNLTVREVEAAITLLDAVHPEAVELLKDKLIAPKALGQIRKVQPLRQIEMAELMVTANVFTASYAEALVLGTPKDQLVHPEQPKKKERLLPEQIAKMEEEMQTLERDLKAVEESYGENMLNLTVARGYVGKLIENARVTRYLGANYSEFLAEFEKMAAAEGL